MRNITFSSLIVLLLSSAIYPQLLAPLNLNNSWIYEDELGYRNKQTIIDTAHIIDSIKYCKVWIQTYNSMQGYNEYIRLNQDSFYVWRNEPNPDSVYEEPYYKKNAQLGETWTHPADSTSSVTVTNVFPYNVFGVNVTIKVLKYIGAGGLVEIDRAWSEEFGRHNDVDFWGIALETLEGCIINGIAYGDTSFYITNSVNEIDGIKSLNLSQNYPNPFNSSTVIKYNLPSRMFVSLTLYNNLGEEVKSLVKEEQATGNYEYLFNSEALSSGIYYYQLTADDFIQTKKMILMK